MKKALFIATFLLIFASAFTDSDTAKLGLERPRTANYEDNTSSLVYEREIVEHEYYTLSYREYYEQSEWVCYVLSADELIKAAKRQNNFRSDPSISTHSATPEDYVKSGYDRGHLAPAADFAFSSQAMSESFYMSNMSPQAPALNRKMWKDLEETVRIWAKNFGKVYVATGPVLEKTDYPTIGKNKVSVPEYYYKVLLSPIDKTQSATSQANPSDTCYIMIAFILPNKDCEGEIWDYVVTADEVEKRTGIDFFYLLSDDIEEELEANINIENWRANSK
jgi:endonuclease G